tara:strand:+ start:642 stop:926 length:285 start_codon:yes stop_codon:yes gene_type:complete
MERNMDKSTEKDIDHNNDLAFNLAIKTLEAYAQDCVVDKDAKTMDPMLGAYLLVNNLAISLLFKAEGLEQDIVAILKDAIDDAEYKINKSRKAS